ncbi:hypothetical protein IFO70_17260 [Phormidium tenue FACHB-886]|nr:hypothetical protein [Phormidium tenue FACHB-886]
MRFFDAKKNTHAHLLSTQKYLEKHKISSNAIIIHIVVDEKLESTQDYLEKLNIKSDAITTEIDLRTAEAKHRLTSRTIVLLSLVVPMAIAPFWLMVLLSLPALGKKPYSEAMQVAFLAGLVSDFAGLYYVITQDLFPQGNGERRRRLKPEAQQLDKTDSPPQ